MGAHNFQKITRQYPPRQVPGFTIQALQENTYTDKPPKSDFFTVRNVGGTEFRRRYFTAELPLVMDYGRISRPNNIRWLAKKKDLNIHYYLPLFCDGLSEVDYPLNVLAREGACQLLEVAGEEVLPILHKCAFGIRKALNTKHQVAIVNACRVIQKLAMTSPTVARAFVTFHNRMLNILTAFRAKRKKLSGQIDYRQRVVTVENIVDDTLQLLDRTGGPCAYYYLKSAVPTYESTYRNF